MMMFERHFEEMPDLVTVAWVNIRQAARVDWRPDAPALVAGFPPRGKSAQAELTYPAAFLKKGKRKKIDADEAANARPIFLSPVSAPKHHSSAARMLADLRSEGREISLDVSWQPDTQRIRRAVLGDGVCVGGLSELFGGVGKGDVQQSIVWNAVGDDNPNESLSTRRRDGLGNFRRAYVVIGESTVSAASRVNAPTKTDSRTRTSLSFGESGL